MTVSTRVTVLYKNLSAALTKAASVGISSKKNPAARFDCTPLQVISTSAGSWLRTGGIHAMSYATHVPALPDEELEPGYETKAGDAPVFIRNEYVATIKGVGFVANDKIRLTVREDQGIVYIGNKEKGSVAIPLEPSRVHQPEFDGDPVSQDETPWQQVDNFASESREDSLRWLTLPDTQAFYWALRYIPAITAGVHDKNSLPHSAEVVRMVVANAAEDLQTDHMLGQKSGLAFRILGTDDLAVADVCVPVVRRADGEKPRVVSSIGMLEQPVEVVSAVPLYLTLATVKKVYKLLEQDDSVRMRVLFDNHQRPMMMILTNGPSLIRFPIDQSGLYQGDEDICAWLTAKATDLKTIGTFSPDAMFVKGVKMVTDMRGAADRGVALSFGGHGMVVASDEEQPGSARASISWTSENTDFDKFDGCYVEAKRLAATIAAFKGMSVVARMSASVVSLETEYARVTLPILV